MMYSRARDMSKPEFVHLHNHSEYSLMDGVIRLSDKDGKPSQALKDLAEVAKANPKSGLAQYFLARTYVATGRVPEAQAAYRDALKLEPKLEAAKTELALISGEKPDPAAQAQLVERLQEALKKDPKNAGMREALARTYLQQGKTAEAQAELKKLLELAPGHPGANVLMARFLFQEKKPDEAAEHLRAALRVNPSQLEANVLLGGYLAQRGRREEAVKYLETVLMVNPKLLDIKLQLGVLYARVGRLPDALRLAQELEREAPKSPAPPTIKGAVLLGQGKPKAAADAFAAALKIKPDLADAHRGRR